ncbi:MAG: permease-like cell division protein FtsX [Oscillospiraceae bacterium]|nr:permease-like cell division protein FtsX [Oscillospiraceae bacterium]
MRISSIAYLTGRGFQNIWNNRIMSVASFCILTVSMLLVGFSVLFTENINTFIGNVEEKNEVVIFLNDNLTDDDISIMGDRLRQMDNIKSVEFYSKDQAFEDMKAGMDNAEELFDYIGDESPLPDAYRLKVADISRMSSTLMSINSLQGIYSVKAPTDFVSVLTGLRSLVYILSGIIIIALIVVSIVIISNAARASVDMRKREIAIMKYVGATNTFIEVPFFIEGMIMGIFAGTAAILLTWAGYVKIIDVLMSDSTIWLAMGIKGFIPFSKVALRMAIVYITAGAVVGSFGTLLSTKKYVKV